MTDAARHLLDRHGDAVRADIALILGSGLGGLADAVQDAVAIRYADLPGFAASTVSGHAGRLVVGTLAGRRVAVLQGRAHVYELPPAHAGPALTVGVRTVAALGATTLVATNAAGSLRPEVPPGHLMVLSDHINLMGVNPLVGPNDDALGPRFVGLGDAYDAGLRAQLLAAAQRAGVPLAEGVYLAVSGPSFETPAEIRAFRTLGADAVGMSTVPEVIVARHAGLRVAAISAITNLAEGMGGEPLSHEQTLASAADGARHLQTLLTTVLPEL
ncbi:purine-nucleoside phosphorylase [Paraconexibacter antarcticus]|uniref:Purine nucleoside phosphorylase n=1 Tax=Paraconexibacter antarcticus TaxID=2949664 RepID=A0ABY5DY64_9ACTN|nr:purine-nucleoside phosphorylase [Paraconexibacter antarcticus]UTI65807.1 purine-nucleoside phosphorylase [Paraconexibacter antarcticus]